MIELEIIHPSILKSVEIHTDYFVFKSHTGETIRLPIIGQLSDYLYYFELQNRAMTLIHDGKFAASDIRGENILNHNNSNMGFWELPPYNALFLEVSKNACSTVVSEIYNNFYIKKGEVKLTTQDWIWDFLQNRNELRNEMNISVEKFLENENRYKTIFLVYDDPLKRFVRCLNNKYTKQHRILSVLQPPYDKNISEFIDKAILLSRLNTLNISKWDQHVTPITVYHKNTLPYVTDIVRIEDLDNFMYEKFNIKPEHYYVSKEKVIRPEHLNETQIKWIKELYKNDYKIPEIYADKFWK